MRFTRAWIVLAAGSLAITTTAILPTAGPATAGTGIPEQAVSLPGGELFGVAATTTHNAWAVGQAIPSGKTIVLHWNGSGWTRVPSPTPSGGGALYAVAATSASNAWAVGGSDGPPGKTEIVHWNGTAWTRVPSPTPPGGGALFGVAATSGRNAWAVGCAGNCFQGVGGIRTLILHWNGTVWKRVPSPSPGQGSSLSSVAAVSAHSAWAVGCTAFCFLRAVKPQTVILHWNGTTWTRVASPAQARFGALNGVAAVSAHSAWAVGCSGHCFGPMATTRTMIVRWNGSAWRYAASPSPAPDSVLGAVAAASASNAWAVGYTRAARWKTLVEHWNGTAWQRVPSPTPGQLSQLVGVAATSARNAWAVGSDLTGLILQHWNGTRWS